MRKFNYLVFFKILFLISYFNLDLQAQTGQIISDSIQVSELNRDYLVYIPEAYDGSEAWPLVLNLHAQTLSANAHIALAQMNPVADTAHFLVVYPNGIAPTPDPNVRIWNPLSLPNQQDDFTFLDNLIDTLSNNFNVDRNRVFMTGGDAGALVTYAFACTMPEKIAAIATIASVIPDSFDISGCVPTIPLPLLHMHGTADPLGPFNGGIDGAGNLAPPVRTVVGDWLNNNGCALDSTVLDFPDINLADSSTVSSIEFSSCSSYLNAEGEMQTYEVLFYIVENGGHNYPGGGPLPAFFGNINKDISASEEIWKFFDRHSLPQEPSTLDLSMQHNGIERKYLLHVPEAYDGSEAWPLILNLHGAGVTRFGQMLESQMNPVADTAHFIVAYPEATLNPFPPLGEVPVWNAILNPDGVDDIDFLKQLIDTITTTYNIDLSRVYSAGKSQGGDLSYSLACQLPNKIAGVASVAGFPALENFAPCAPDRQIPVLHIHGTADLVTPFNGGSGVLGEFPTWTSVNDHLNTWINFNNCTMDSTVIDLPDLDTNDASTVSLIKYENCDKIDLGDGMERNADVWLYRVNGGGHTWPGGPVEQIPPGFEAAFGTINRDFNASSAIWNFFNHSQMITSTNIVHPSTINLNIFPNPSSGELNFQFELSHSSKVNLTLYNSIGQTVAILINQSLEEGKQLIQWNRNNQKLPSGIYYCQLKINDGVINQAISFK